MQAGSQRSAVTAAGMSRASEMHMVSVFTDGWSATPTPTKKQVPGLWKSTLLEAQLKIS